MTAALPSRRALPASRAARTADSRASIPAEEAAGLGDVPRDRQGLRRPGDQDIFSRKQPSIDDVIAGVMTLLPAYKEIRLQEGAPNIAGLTLLEKGV
jgi:hypothetical protein